MKSEIVNEINCDIKAVLPMVDVGIYYPSNVEIATDSGSVGNFARRKAQRVSTTAKTEHTAWLGIAEVARAWKAFSNGNSW